MISFLLKLGHFLAFIKDSGSYLFNFSRPSLTHPGGKTDVLPHYYQVGGGVEQGVQDLHSAYVNTQGREELLLPADRVGSSDSP